MWTEGFAFRNALPAQTGTLNTCDDLHQLTDVCCSYAVFCKDMIIPRKTVNIYPNNKPWVTRAVKKKKGGWPSYKEVYQISMQPAGS